jgi:hypothetical protein
MIKSTTLPCVFALSLVAALSSSCMQKPACQELGNCGGPVPIGTWVLQPGTESCTEDLYEPASDPRLIGGAEIPAARTPPIEPAVYDWCDLLVTSSGTSIQTHAANFYAESAPVGRASIRIDANGHWAAGITRTGTYVLDFPTICMREFGAMDGRSIDPMATPPGPPGTVCQQLQVTLRASGLGNGAYPNTTCQQNPADLGGCLCAFDVTATGGPSGYYSQINSNTLQFLPGTNFPENVTYCNEDTTLELTGADGEYLFGTKGLRTLRLAKFVPNCTDGSRGDGEDGVDCGGGCPNACPP